MQVIYTMMLGVAMQQAYGGEVCQRCERIREYNAAHPENNYYYYEDYLKDQENTQVAELDDSSSR